MQTVQAIKKLREFYFKHKRLPTYTEIAKVFNYSSRNGGFKFVQKLIKEGIIAKDTNGQLVPKNLFSIPLLGIIHAGIPQEANAQEDSLDLYNFIFNIPGDVFSLRVRGDSMNGEGINEGDIVIVDHAKKVRNGDIVAACVDGEWTIKYFQKNLKGEVSLIPANKAYKIIYPKESLEIGGVVINVIRTYC